MGTLNTPNKERFGNGYRNIYKVVDYCIWFTATLTVIVYVLQSSRDHVSHNQHLSISVGKSIIQVTFSHKEPPLGWAGIEKMCSVQLRGGVLGNPLAELTFRLYIEAPAAKLFDFSFYQQCVSSLQGLSKLCRVCGTFF